MNCEFKSLEIWHVTRGGTQICWGLSQNTFFRGRHHFFVDYGQPATDEWITLNAEPIVDDCCYFDECQRNWADLIDHYYRVRLVLPDEPGCPVFKSMPQRANGRLDRKKWLVARDIIRREYLQQRKVVGGTKGFLLKRKKFGRACPVCLDWDTKEVRDSDCPVCYGTGFEGGYYPAIEYWITTDANWNRKIVSGQPPRGTSSDIDKTGRCILYPVIDTRDVWVRADNDERYIIDGYGIISEIASVPLIAQARIKLAPATDIVYSVPLTPTPSSSSVSSQQSDGVQCGVDSGLDSSYEDW